MLVEEEGGCPVNEVRLHNPLSQGVVSIEFDMSDGLEMVTKFVIMKDTS